ncbi:MAG: hypothetical protein V4714_10895 [Bacteroidota bacterium]
MAELTYFVPIRLLLPGWPSNFLGVPPQLDSIGLPDFETTGLGPSLLVVNGTIQILETIEFELPLIPGLSLALLSAGDYTEFAFKLGYYGDRFDLTLSNLSVAIRVSSALFKRMEATAGGYVEAPPDPITGQPLPIEVAIEGTEIALTSEGQFTFAPGTSALTIQPFMVGESGIIVDITSLKLILSDAAALELPASIPADWRGVYLEQATIHLPDELAGILPQSIAFQNAFVGSGGFCGSVFFDLSDSVTAYDEATAKTIFGFGFTFQFIEVEFQQNTLTKSSIKGFMKVPFFDEAVELEIGLANDGDFTLALGGTEDGLFLLKKDNVISIEVNSLEFIHEEEEYCLKMSGKVTPLLPGLDWPSFELKELTICSDGTVRVEGGWIALPELKTLDFYGFKVEITKLGFGSDETDGVLAKWIGFSGGIQLVDGLPLRGGVEGLKVMWWYESDGTLQFKLKIGGVYLSFEIENTLSFDGTAFFIDEVINEEKIQEFRGGVDVALIPLNFGVDAQFICGKTEDYTYFYLFIDVDLPVGIPLGPPVLGLYGLAGLYGHNMTLDYQKLINYETVEDRPDLSDAANWQNKKGAMAFGAGLTVGTLPDTKFTVKVKALFVILIPGPVLLIEGHVGMLSLGENYLMQVLAVLDPTAGTFLMNISAQYAFPKDPDAGAKLLDIFGSAEAFFSAGDPDAWHLYLGENEPESKRIRADILDIFKAQTYLMVDHDGLRMGAWIGYSLDQKFGILRVILEAWMGGELALSTMPLQAKGSMTLYGNAELSAGIVSLGISVEANVTVEAPKPLYISAYLEVQLKTPLGKPKAKITLKWEKTGTPPFPIPLSPSLGIEHRKVTKNWDVPKYSIYETDDDGLYKGSINLSTSIPNIPVVPPDVYLVLNFDKPMEDLGVGDNPAVKPPDEMVGDYRFAYALKSVTLEYCDDWNESSEITWNNYEEFVKTQVENGENAYQLSGAWQAIPSTEQIVNTKLVLNASTPFEISRQLESNESWLGLLDVYNPHYPCSGTAEEKWTCAEFESRDYGTYYPLLIQDEFIFMSVFPMEVQPYEANWLGTTKAVSNVDSYESFTCLWMKDQEPTERINLKIIDNIIFSAGIGYDSYIFFTNEFSGDEIELYISYSVFTATMIPAAISFPELAFNDRPYKVNITCIKREDQTIFLLAFDQDWNPVDITQQGTEDRANGTITYHLESQTTPIRHIGMLGEGIRITKICYAQVHTTGVTSILVTMPENMDRTEVHLSKDSQGTLYLYDKVNHEIGQLAFDIPASLSDEEVQPVELNLAGQTFRSFLLSGHFKLIRVCGVTEDDHATYVSNADLDTHLQTSLDENWGQHTAQILHPNKYYRLNIVTTATWYKGGSSDFQEFSEYMYFKTGNPPGPPAPTQEEEADTDRYDLVSPLSDLSAYIDYTIPAGAVAGEAQGFIYRSYDIGVVYNDSYIDQMYQMAGFPIKIRLLDNNNLPVLNAAGEELELLNLWGDNPELSQTREEKQYQDVLNASGCVVMTAVTVESNQEVIASSRELLLSPQIQYRAQVVAGEQAIYEFAFLSSRYANFMHHLYSFADIVWNHFDLITKPDFEIEAAVLEQILANSEEEPVKFEQLMALFDLNPRPLPDQLEITLLNDKNQTYGLLLETPEPLDWERCEWSVSFANTSETIDMCNQAVKLVGGSVEEGIGLARLSIVEAVNTQWVDVLLLETTDLSDFIVEYKPVSSPAEEAYLAFYRFDMGTQYNAGTVLRIYNGTAPTSTAEETEQIHLYANHSSFTFSSQGTFVRIKNKAGEILHTRVMYTDTVFNALTVNILRSGDATRAFFFVENGAQPFMPLENGLYQLSMTYKRDIGPEKPLLKRFGFSEAEEVVLLFSLPAGEF